MISWRNKKQTQISFFFQKNKMFVKEFANPNALSKKKKCQISRIGQVESLFDSIPLLFMAAKIIKTEEDHPSEEICNPMDEALISPPENASLKFLTPSRRCHPHVEPLLDTYKICHIKWWLNHFLKAFKKQFYCQIVSS